MHKVNHKSVETCWKEITPIGKKTDKILDPAAAIYEHASKFYDRSMYGQITIEEINFYYQALAGCNTVLEIGSGTGRLSLPLLKKGISLYGIDASPAMLRVLVTKLLDRHKNRFILSSALDTPYPAEDGSFDAIIIPFSSFSSIHGDAWDAIENNSVLKEFHRLLSSQGRVLINNRQLESVPKSKVTGDRYLLETRPHFNGDRENIQENVYYCYNFSPSHLLPNQVICTREIQFMEIESRRVVETHEYSVPCWSPEDYALLASDAGFILEKSIPTPQFHYMPTVTHILRKA